MDEWLTIRNCIIAGASLAFVAMPALAAFVREFRKLSHRGAVAFIAGAVIATGVAQKRSVSDGSGLQCQLPATVGMLRGSGSTHPEDPPAYTNPIRIVSFAHNSTSLSVSVSWDWEWSPDARYHHVDVYGTHALPSNRWVDAGRFRLSNWGVGTNQSIAVDWPAVFSNAVASGDFPPNATLAAGFLSTFPELDTDGDGLPDGDEAMIHGSRWDLAQP